MLSEDLISNPEGVLRAMCDHAGLDFDPAMLRWPSGPKPYDGVWASYWYRTVHQSTGTLRRRRSTDGILPCATHQHCMAGALLACCSTQ